MTLTRFDYVSPTTLPDAIGLLSEPGSLPIAGGHHLLTRLRRREIRVERLVDLTRIADLRGIAGTAGGGVRIGALTTLTELLGKDAGRGSLTDALSQLGDRQSRNRATVGGQLASGRPGNDLVAALLTQDTTVSLAGRAGTRQVPLAELLDGPRPALRPAELIVSIELGPVPAGSGYARMTDRALLEAVCGVAVAVRVGPDGLVEDCRIAAVGATATPGRLATMEASVVGTDGSGIPSSPPADAVFLDDRLASGEYRRHMTRMLAGRALALAVARTRTAVPVGA